jgi:8-oxo-dGTP diphosphatase
MSDREYPDNPIAGVGVVVMKDDHVLIIRRGREPRIGQWSIPGGKQELGETWREAATREVLEETAVEIKIIGIVDVVDAIIRDDDSVRPGIQDTTALNEPPSDTPEGSSQVKYHYTLVDCVALWTTGEPLAGGDAAHAEWWPLNRIDELSLWAETVRIIREAAAIAATHS